MATNRAGVRSYMANLGKSILYSSKQAVAVSMPTLSGTIDNNKEAIKSGVSYVKETISSKSSNSNSTSSIVSTFLKDIEEIKNKAFEEIKTGKFVDFDKKADSLFDDMGFGDMDIDWGDGSSDPFADFDNPNEESSIDPLASINAIKTSAKVSEIGSNLRTKALMETMADTSEKSANYIAKTNAKLQSISMTMQSQMHVEVLKSIGDTNKLLTSVVEFNNSTMVDHFNKQLTFYDNVLEELRAIKESLKKEEPQAHRGKQTTFDNIISSSGGINLAEYGKQIKKNFSNMIAETPLGMMSAMSQMGGGGGMMSDIKKNPMQFVSQLLAYALIPGSIKSALGQLDSSLSGLISATAMKINSGKNSPNWLKSTFSSLFGLDLSYKTGLDMSSYNKGAVSYNAKSDKALTEVIPTLLTHILSTLSGSEKIAFYDYNRGKFVDGKSVFKTTKERISYEQKSNFFDIRENMKRSLSTVPGGTSDAMMKDLDTFIEYMTHNFYNPIKQTSASAMASKGLKLSDERVYNALRAAFLNMPKHLQNSASTASLKSRASMTNTLNSVERELFESGLSAAYSGLGEFKGPAAKSMSGAGQVTNLLKDIRNILIDGIFVYGNTTDKATVNALHDRMRKNKTNMANVATKTVTQKVGDHVATTGELDELMDTPFEKLQESMAKNSFLSQSQTESKFFSSLLGEKDVMKKMRIIKDNVTSPTRIITGIIGRMDSMIYRIIYGKQPGPNEDSEDGAPKTGIFGKMTDALNKGIDKTLLFIDKKILSPLHETFFGEQGLFTKFMESFDPFIDKMKTAFGTGATRFAKYIVGEKTAAGFYTGGALSDVGNMFVDFGNQMRGLLTGGAYEKSDGTKVEENKNNVFAYIKSYSKSLMESIKDGLFGERKTITNDDGTIKIVRDEKGGLLTGVIDNLKSTMNVFNSLFKTKEDESPEDTKKTIDDWKKEFKGFLPKGLAGGLAGMTASLVLPGGPILGAMLGSTLAFASHSQKFRNYLFGDDETGKEGVIPKKYVDGFKKYFPSMAAGGVLGMLGSVVLPGGPLLGLTLGSSIAFASKSEKVQEFLFGKVEDGKVLSEGLLGPEFKDKLKKVLPSMGAGGLLGIAGSIILPGGPLLGLTLGSAIGFAAKSERVQEFLFGKTKDGEVISEGLIPNSVREKLKAVMPKAMAGGLAGALSGAVGFLTPGGPFVGALIGATLSIAGTSDRVKNFLFGEEDPETHKRKGGLFGQVRDFMNKELFEPFKEWRKRKGVQIQEWFQNAISKPFQEALTPFKKAMGVIGDKFRSSFVELKDSFKNAFNRVFEKSVGMPLGELVKKHITDPMKNMLSRLFDAIGKGLSKILTSPITFMTAFANSVLEKEGIATTKNDEKSLEQQAKIEEEKRQKLSKTFKQAVEETTNASKSSSTSGDKKKTFGGLFKDLLTAQVKPGGVTSSLLALPAPTTIEQKKQTDIQQKLVKTATASVIASNVEKSIADTGKGVINGSISSLDSTKRRKTSLDQPFVGQIDLTKFYAKVGLMESHLRKIKDEISGQLNGVGWNLEYIANILTDRYGKPSKMPTEIAKRGNLRRRGLLGTLINMIKSPLQSITAVAKAVVLKPFQMLYNNINKIVTGIAKTVGKTITTVVKLPFTIIQNAIKITGNVLSGLTKIGEIVGPTIQKSIKLVFDTVGNIVTSAGKVLNGAFAGVGNILSGIGKAVGDGIGIVSKFAKITIPMLTKGITNALSFVGSTILKIGNFAKDILVNTTKAIGSIFKISIPGIGKKPQKVEVVGGKLDSVTTVKEVHTVYHIYDGQSSGVLGTPGIINTASNIGQRLGSRFRSVMSSLGSIGRKKSASVDGSHAAGLDMVPRDGYVAKLHKGEMIIPSHQAEKIRRDAGRLTGSRAGISNEVHGVLTDKKKSGLWRRIGRGMKSFVSGINRPDTARIYMINSIVQRVHDQSSYDEATLGMLHQIAINTTTSSEESKKSGSSLTDLLGLLPAAITALNGLTRAIPRVLSEGLEAVVRRVFGTGAGRAVSDIFGRLLTRLGLRAGTEVAGHAAENIVKRSGAKLLGEGVEAGGRLLLKESFEEVGEHAAKRAANDMGKRIVLSQGVELLDDGMKRSTSRIAQDMKYTPKVIDVTPMKAGGIIDTVKDNAKKVSDTLTNFFQKIFTHEKMKKFVGKDGLKVAKDIMNKLKTSGLLKNSLFISRILTGIAKGSAKIGISASTAGIGDAVFAVWNATTALVHRGDAAALFNVYESDVTPKMRLVAAGLKTLLGISWIFILELLSITVTELTGGQINVTKMIANSMYNLISDDEAYEDLSRAQLKFQQDAEMSGMSLSEYNHAVNARFEEKLWEGTKKAWNKTKPIINKTLDATTGIGMFRAFNDMRNTDNVRQVFNLGEDDKVNFMQRLSTGSGSMMEKVSFGLIDGDKAARGMYDTANKVITGTQDFFSNLGKGAKDGINNLWNSDQIMILRNLASSAWGSTMNVLNGLKDAASELHSAIVDRLKHELGRFGSWIGDKWKAMTDWVGEKWDETVGKRIDLFIEGFNTRVRQINEFWDEHIAGPFNDFISDIKEKINNFLQPVHETMEMFSRIWKIGKDAIVQKVKDMTGIDISQGVVQGVLDKGKDVWDNLWSRGKETSEDLKDKSDKTSKSFADRIRDIGSNAATWIRGDADGSHAAGLDNVPFDGYKAILHKGEMVIPGDQANAIRMAAGMQPVNLGATQQVRPSVDNILVNTLANTAATSSNSYGPRLSNVPSKLTTSDSDADIRKEFGYVLNAPASDFTVEDLKMVKALCSQYGVNPHLWLALVETESSFNSKTRNRNSSATGWGQIIRSTGRYIYEDLLKLGTYNHETMASNKEINARMSIYYLGKHLKNYASPAQALQRYNGGELGAEYSNRVANKLMKNAGLHLNQVINPTATGLNTYDPSSSSYGSNINMQSNTPEQVTSMSGALGLLSKAGGEALTELYGVDVNNLMTDIPNIFNLADPFAKWPSENDAGGGGFTDNYSMDPNLQSIANMSSADTAKANAYASYLRSKYPALSGDVDIHDFLAARINKLAMDKGRTVNITSGWRSPSEQQALIDNWHRKNPGKSVTERRQWVADVGSSRHELGLAADMSGWIKSIPASELARYGLHKPVSNEDWHFEAIETKGLTTSQMRNMVGFPFAPAPGLSSFINSGYNTSSGTANQYGPQVNWNQYNPMMGYEIGDGQSGVSIDGAPSASGYLTKTSLAAKSIKSSSLNPNDDVVVKLLTIIAEHLGTLVDLTDEYKQFLIAVVNGKTKDGQTPTVAIVNTGSPTTTTPLNAPKTKKSSKRDEIRAILRETII